MFGRELSRKALNTFVVFHYSLTIRQNGICAFMSARYSEFCSMFEHQYPIVLALHHMRCPPSCFATCHTRVLCVRRELDLE